MLIIIINREYSYLFISLAGKKRKPGKENVACSNDFIDKVLQSTFGKLVTKSGVTLGEDQNKISKSLWAVALWSGQNSVFTGYSGAQDLFCIRNRPHSVHSMPKISSTTI